MTAKKVYNFATNYNASPTHVFIAKQKYLNPDLVAKSIEKYMKTDLRSTQDYSQAKDVFIELTMSCNRKEAVS